MTKTILEIIDALEKQKASIERALEALMGVEGTARNAKAGRSKKIVRKGMSEEGRKKIAKAQRKRWAMKKRAAKKAVRAT